ncbi:LuxR C-terminal-related transcriptional regulator [Streptomyces sp. NPDC055709]
MVGRDEALAECAKALHQRQATIIRGPSGIGKTRLATEFLKLCQSQGHKCGKISAIDPNTAPLAALAQYLPSHVATNYHDSFRHIVEQLSSRSASQGKNRRKYVLMVDNLHLLDAASLLLISQLSDIGLIFVVATLKSGVSREALDAWQYRDSVHNVKLHELSHEKTELLLSVILPGTLTPHTTASFHRSSGGNPFFIRELAIHAITSGLVHNDGITWHLMDELRIPSRIEERIIQDLPSDTSLQRVLRELALREEGDVKKFDRQDILQLEFRNLVRVAGGTVQVSNPIARDIILSFIPQEEAASAHFDDQDRDGSFFGAVTHKPSSADLPSLVPTARVSHQGPGGAAQTTSAHPDSTKSRRRLVKSHAFLLSGNVEAANYFLKLAHEHATTDDERKTIALQAARIAIWTDDRLVSLESGNARVQTFDAPHLNTTSYSDDSGLITAYAATFRGKFNEAAAYARRDEDSTGSNTDPLLPLIRISGLIADGKSSHGLEAAEKCLVEYPDMDSLAIPTFAESMAFFILALAETGKVREAYLAGRTSWRNGEAGVAPVPQITISLSLARCALIQGRPITAKKWAGQAAQLARMSSLAGPLRAALDYLAEAAILTGAFEMAAEVITEAERLPRWGYFSLEGAIGRAWYAAARGDLKCARNLLRMAAVEAKYCGNTPSEARLLVEIVRLVQDEEAVSRLMELAEAADGDLTIARANYAVARLHNDPGFLGDSADGLQRCGAVLLAAEASARAATLWRRRGARRQATAASNLAFELAKECEGASSSELMAVNASMPLTTRETEIAVLVAQGLTNAEVSEKLNISRRTVENHLQSVYRKLGVASRKALSRMIKGDFR